MADQVVSQLTQLQAAVSSGKQALQEASSIMGTIRPEPELNFLSARLGCALFLEEFHGSYKTGLF